MHDATSFVLILLYHTFITSGQQVRLVTKRINGQVGWQVGRLVGCQVDRQIGWQVGRLVGRLDRQVGKQSGTQVSRQEQQDNLVESQAAVLCGTVCRHLALSILTPTLGLADYQFPHVSSLSFSLTIFLFFLEHSHIERTLEARFIYVYIFFFSILLYRISRLYYVAVGS